MNLIELVAEYVKYIELLEDYYTKCIDVLDKEMKDCEDYDLYCTMLARRRKLAIELRFVQRLERDKKKITDYIKRICKQIRQILFIGEKIDFHDYSLQIFKIPRRKQGLFTTDYKMTKKLRAEGKLRSDQFAYYTNIYYYFLKGTFRILQREYYIAPGRGPSSIITQIYNNEVNSPRYANFGKSNTNKVGG